MTQKDGQLRGVHGPAPSAESPPLADRQEIDLPRRLISCQGNQGRLAGRHFKISEQSLQTFFYFSKTFDVEKQIEK